MSDEHKLIRDRERATRAKLLLEDELLKGAFETIKTQYAERLLSTPVDRAEDREQLYRAYRVVNEVERHLTQILNDGTLAEAELRNLERMNQPKAVWANVR